MVDGVGSMLKLDMRQRINYNKRARELGHNVPRAGTLWQISYCCMCGYAFDTDKKCKGKLG